jgi:hypothetical protein
LNMWLYFEYRGYKLWGKSSGGGISWTEFIDF